MKKRSSAAKKIRLVIADDHPVVRDGLAALLRSQSDMIVVGEAANGAQAVRQYLLRRPDVLLLDLRMPGMDGIDTIQAIHKKASRPKILVLSTYDGDEDIYRALKAGAKAYLLKDSRREQLLESIRAVHEGRLSIPSEIGARLAARMAAPSLTKREFAVLRLMVSGKSNKGIGAILDITEGTIKVHAGRIFRKLGAGGRTEAIRFALERGIVHLNARQAE